MCPVSKAPVRDNLVAVVVPIYKDSLSGYERIAITQCHKVLSAYPIIYATHSGVDLTALSAISSNFSVKLFPGHFFESVASYSRLMLSAGFYEAFRAFKYILIYQLDAFAFEDRLGEWCGLNYDYVGAPWIGVPPDSLKNGKMGTIRTLLGMGPKMVGNGGFSLRKTRKFITVLRLLKGRAEGWRSNEDGFWSQVVPSLIPNFRIPEIHRALDFAFELEPRTCYTLNNEKLPFGCHAWEKHDIDFWRPHFEALGYKI